MSVLNNQTALKLETLRRRLESTGQNCYFFKATDGKWYMALEDRFQRDEYDYYGPFESEDAAIDYLDNFANPGGYSVYDDGKMKPPKNPIKPTSGKALYVAKVPWR
jgi:hypothetical protein